MADDCRKYADNSDDIKEVITQTVKRILESKGYNVSIVDNVPQNVSEYILSVNAKKVDVVYNNERPGIGYVELSMVITHKMLSPSKVTLLNYAFEKKGKEKYSATKFFIPLLCIFPIPTLFIMQQKIADNLSAVANQYLEEYAQALQSKIPAAFELSN